MIDQEKWTLVLNALNELSGRIEKLENKMVRCFKEIAGYQMLVDGHLKETGDALSVEIESLRKKVTKLAKRKK